MNEDTLITTPIVKAILEKYPNKQKFLLEAIKIFDRLISFHMEIKGYNNKHITGNQWQNLISSCHKSIDFLIETSFESGYCRFENDD